jgi:hypothetical protein
MVLGLFVERAEKASLFLGSWRTVSIQEDVLESETLVVRSRGSVTGFYVRSDVVSHDSARLRTVSFDNDTVGLAVSNVEGIELLLQRGHGWA